MVQLYRPLGGNAIHPPLLCVVGKRARIAPPARPAAMSGSGDGSGSDSGSVLGLALFQCTHGLVLVIFWQRRTGQFSVCCGSWNLTRGYALYKLGKAPTTESRGDGVKTQGTA